MFNSFIAGGGTAGYYYIALCEQDETKTKNYDRQCKIAYRVVGGWYNVFGKLFFFYESCSVAAYLHTQSLFL